MAMRYFNWKLAIVLVVAAVVCTVAAFSLHRWRRSSLAEQALARAEQAYAEKRWDEAADDFGRYLAVNGKDVPVLIKYADAQAKRRPQTSANIGRAISVYRTALLLRPDDLDSAKTLTQLYMMMGQFSEAASVAERHLKRKEDPELRVTYAAALWQMREFDKALAEVNRITAQHPTEIRAFEMAGGWDENRPNMAGKSRAMWLDEAVAKNPDAALAYAARAAYYLDKRNTDRAKTDLTRALQCDLSGKDVRLRVARELTRAGMGEQAREQLRILQTVDPTDAGLWMTWAQVASDAKSPEEMYAVAEQGMKALGADMWDFMPVATHLLILSGHLEKVPDYLSKMRNRDLNPVRVSFLEGLLAYRENRTRDAVDAWRRTVSFPARVPDQISCQMEAYWRLAGALHQLGETQAAIGQLQTLLAKRPDHAEASLLLAQLLAQSRTGDWQRVVDQAAAAQQLAKNDPNAVARAALLELEARIQNQALGGSADANAVRTEWNAIEAKVDELDKKTGGAIEVKLLRVRIAVQRQRFAEADRILADLETRYPADMRVMLLRAEYCVVENKDTEALASFRQAMTSFPDAFEPVRRFAWFLNLRNLKQDCESVVTEAFARIQEPQTRRNLGLLMAELYQVWGEKDKGYRWLTDLTAKFPGDIQSRRMLLDCEAVAADPQRSQALVDEIKKIEGPAGSLWRYEQAELWARSKEFGRVSGTDVSKLGETSLYAQIVKLLQENLLANPDDQASRLLLARVYDFVGERQLALTTYSEAHDRVPGDTRVIEFYVRALVRAREFGRAQAILDKLGAHVRESPALLRLQAMNDIGREKLASASDTLRQLIEQEPNDITLQLYQADLLTRQKQYAQAEAILSALWARRPDSAGVALALMEVRLLQGKKQEAMALCEEVIEKLHNAPAYMVRARAYILLKDYDKALTDLGQAIAVDPKNSGAWELRAGVHEVLGRLPEAIADIRQALALSPDQPRVQGLAVRLFARSGSGSLRQEAEGMLRKAIADPKNRDPELVLLMARLLVSQRTRTGPALTEARSLLRQLTEENPRNVAAWATWADLELQQGDASRAMEVATRGLAHNEENRQLLLLKALAEKKLSPSVAALTTLRQLAESDPNDLEVLLHWADAYVLAERPREAVAKLTERLDRFSGPARRSCEIALARTLYSDGQKEKAHELFSTLIAADPNDPAPVMTLGQLLRQEKRWTEVNQLLNLWRIANPSDARTSTDMAHILAGSGDQQALQMAEDQLRMILDANPNAVPTLVLLSMLMQDAGRNEEATRLNRRIIELDPNNVVAINNLAWVLCEEDGVSPATLKQALDLANRGLAVLPDYADLLDTRGVVYYRQGEFEKAVADFTQCISLFPLDASLSAAPRFHLARAYAALHHRVEAVERLKEALNLNRRNIRLAKDHADAGRVTHAIKVLRDAVTLQEEMDQFKTGFDLQDPTIGRYATDWVDAKLLLDQLQRGR